MMLRSPDGHVFALKCRAGKGPLPLPVLQSLYIPPPGPEQAGPVHRPLAVLVTTYVPDEMTWTVAAGSNILIVYLPPANPPAAAVLKVLIVLKDLENVLAGRQKDMGEVVSSVDNQRTAGSAVSVAAALGRLGCYREALQLYGRPMSELSSRLGWNNPAILDVRLYFAEIMAFQGLRDDAEREFQAVYEGRLATFGQAHPATQYAFSKLTEARHRRG
jgi:hypothetical protein